MLITATASGDIESTLDDVVKGLRKGQRAVGKAVATAARKSVLADVKAKRGSLTMSRMGPRARLGIKTTVDAAATSSLVTLVAKPAGMWAITEYGTRPHRIRAARAGGLFVRGHVYEYVDHPGSSGRRYWQGATDSLAGQLDDSIRDAFDDAMEGV